MLIIHMLGLLLRMALRLLAIDVIQALSLDELINFRARNTDEEFLGKLMGDLLSCGQKLSVSCTTCVGDVCEGEGKGMEEGRGGGVPTLLALTILEDLEGAEGGSSC